MQFLNAIKKGLIKLLEWALIIMFAVLVLDVLCGVLTRSSGDFCRWLVEHDMEPWAFLPRGQYKWTDELATVLFMWVSLIGAALAYGSKSHLGVDYFVGKLDPSARRVTEVAVNILVGIFFVSAMIIGGSILSRETFLSEQVLPTLGWNKGYVYLAVPICGFFTTLFCVENILEIITGKMAESPVDQKE